MLPFLISIPHSGEKIPAEVTWLKDLPEEIVMCDVDRYVDRLYQPVIDALKIDHVVAEWHRYVVDLNRLADDVDAESVDGHKNPPGTFTTGLLWVKTTTDVRLMKKPISGELHAKLVADYFMPFHEKIHAIYKKMRDAGIKETFHLDAHSMPSWGTKAHRDPGERRAEIVVSDFNGKSCRPEFKELVIAAYKEAGFQVSYNWPYIGGRLTQQYGKPEILQHAIQVELRRDLYMDEKTKRLIPQAEETKKRLRQAVEKIVSRLDQI
jgi:N-formylglutamate amidohydrolase